ncbi:MAG: pre-rRNA processing protein Esf1 [Piptocephalis tieghemiana]|nr:MAG: pre-rRNA processing protein Esf1 [Piptocephalis tieghemiana]
MAKSSQEKSGHAPATKDPRFQKLHTDPRFRRPKRADHKVKLDERFAHALTDAEFARKPKVDRRGRRVEKEEKNELERYYTLDKEDEEEESGGEESEEEKSMAGRYDPMRGEGVSSSSEDESSEEEDADEAGIVALGKHGKGGVLGKKAMAALEEEEEEEEEEEVEDIPHGDQSKRLAVVNLDWDHVRAMDLYAVLNGFKPDGGTIHAVTIYPSEFGKERLEMEATQGPPKELFVQSKSTKKGDDDDKDEEDEEEEFITTKNLVKEDQGEEVDGEALRKYQLERLRYYYAVVECDSVATASTLYTQCDGAEYESSANFFDLRFIPDDVTFDDTPRDTATGVVDGYKPREFSTLALQHSEVKLTWDEDDVDRTSVTRRSFTEAELEEQDFQAYVASSSEEEEDEEEMRRKYKALLLHGDEDANPYADTKDEENGEMEITFAPGLTERVSAKLEERSKAKKQAAEEKAMAISGETPLEKYMRKQKERRQARKEESMELGEGATQAFSDDEVDGFDVSAFTSDLSAQGEEEKGKGKKQKRTKAERMERRAAREEKEREKKELELLLMEDEHEIRDTQGKTQGGEGRHFDMKDILKAEKARGKKGKAARKASKALSTEDAFVMDVQDERFAPVHESHLFALDPTNPNFKRTKAMENLMQERRNRQANGVTEEENSGGGEEGGEKRKTESGSGRKIPQETDISSLVKSIKRKAQQASASSASADQEGKKKKKKVKAR